MRTAIVAALRELAGIVGQVLVIVITLWTIGACMGVVAIGYCMVAHCV